MDDELWPLLRAVLDEPVVVRVRHELGGAQRRLLDRLGARVVVDPGARACVRQCGRPECAVSVRVNDRVRVEHGRDGEIVVMAAWCGKCKCEVMPVADGDCPWCGSRIVDESQLSARAMLGQLNGRGLEETAALDRHADAESIGADGAVPDKAVVSSSPEPGPVQPAPSPEGEPDPAGDGARYRPPVKWTRERCIAVVREVGEKVGRTPTIADMKAAGFVSVTVSSTTLARLGLTWKELLLEAGFEPRAAFQRPVSSEREPEATGPAEAEVAPSRRALLAAEGAASRSDVLLRAVALAARAFADAILEEA